MKVYLTAIIKAKPDQADVLKNVLQEMVIDSRKEQACLQYDLHQSLEDKNIFIFNEIWANQEGLDLHNNQPYLKAFQTESKAIIDEVIIYKSNKIS